jgi:hypothetical protein
MTLSRVCWRPFFGIYNQVALEQHVSLTPSVFSSPVANNLNNLEACVKTWAPAEENNDWLAVRIGPRVNGEEDWARRGTLVTKCTESGGG